MARNRYTPIRTSASLGAVDRALSDAQDALTSLVNVEVKASDPASYRFGDDLYAEIEKLRRRILARRR